METNAILKADVLDIIFEGRNKEYGAYELRRTYNKRLRISLAVMLLVTLLLFIGQLLASKQKPGDELMVILPPDAQIENIEQPVEPPPVIPPPQPPPLQIQTVQYTTPKIVDEDVPEDEKPPEMTELEDAKIDVIDQEGAKDVGVVAPPEDDKERGIIEAPKVSEEDLNKPFMKVEFESEYPGGKAAWERFLKRNLRYPQEAMDNEIQGTVLVQFVVDREGNVSDVKAIAGPQELRQEAIRVIMKSGKWTAAIQNGNKVPSYKKQPIGFALMQE
jgi:periplasmic protein TonB